MNLVASRELVFDLFKLGLYFACAYTALVVYARHVKTGWLQHLSTRRVAVLTLLSLMLVAFKVFEDVIAKESGPIDTALLWFVRQTIPPAVGGFFALITLSGAAI